jgi:hypothetical protein
MTKHTVYIFLVGLNMGSEFKKGSDDRMMFPSSEEGNKHRT